MNEYRAIARVLIIEDDVDVARSERAMLERAGYETEVAQTGREGLELLARFKPEVVLLDVSLPDMSGFDVCTTIAETADAFIVMMGGQSNEDLKLTGLELGADDFLIKPLAGPELIARIGSFLRRRERLRSRDDERRQRFGDLELVRDTQAIEHAGRSARLTTLEYRLFSFLAGAGGRLCTRAEILDRVWDNALPAPTRVIDVHVAALRKKLETIGAAVAISSVRGVGYRLDL